MKHLSIAHVAIRQHDGLYSLNDLHQASGGEAKHQPALFLRLDATQALIEEIEKTNSANLQSLEIGNSHSTDMQSAVKTINGGKYRGTYACKELVIAYAAWISAAFHLKVINVFLDNLQTRKPQTPLKQLSDAARAFKAVFQSLRVLDLDKNAAAIRANQAIRQQGNLDFLAITGSEQLKAENQDSLHYNPTELGEFIGLTARQVNQALLAAGLQIKHGKRWLPTEEGRPYAYIVDVEKSHNSGAPVQQTRWFDSVLPLIQAAQNPQRSHQA